MFYVSLFSFVFFVAVTMAEVKKEFGEFRINHADIIQKTAPLHRLYSSRSLFKGYFGSNWCSSVDYKLRTTANELSLYDCEAGKFLNYQKQDATTFVNTTRAAAITISDFHYQYSTADVTYYFSLEGRLSHWIPKGKSAIYLIYKNEKLTQVMMQKMPPQKVVLSQDGLILKIGEALTYSYTQGMLQSVSLRRKAVWQYQYDEFLNMTQWRSLTRNEQMKYDSDWDRIVYLKDENNCRFNFQYEVKAQKRYIAESRKCAHSEATMKLFESVNSRPLVKSSTDILGKEFRNADLKTGGQDVETF